MINQEIIEQKVADYINTTSKYPRFILLDTLNYQRFSSILKPKEKIKTLDDKWADIYISRMHFNGFELQILDVNSVDELIEVVG